MQQDSPSLENHDESYFASFTDMLVGIIFIFIILLMISANNFQVATESVTKISAAEMEAKVMAANQQAQIKIAELEAKIAADDAQASAKIATLEAQIRASDLETMTKIAALEAQIKPATPDTAPDMVTKVNDSHDKALDQARSNDAKKVVQNMFFESRDKVLLAVAQALKDQGVPVTVDTRNGLLRLPEESLFSNDDNSINLEGKQVIISLATALGKYVPCISAIKPSQLNTCNELNVSSNDGLDAIFIKDNPDTKLSTDLKWVLSVQRNMALFRDVTYYNPYLDNLKNTFGVPILNVTAHEDRRQSQPKGPANPAFNKTVEIRFMMRNPTPEDIRKLLSAQETQPAANGLGR